jgi:hypothetical protein
VLREGVSTLARELIGLKRGAVFAAARCSQALEEVVLDLPAPTTAVRSEPSHSAQPSMTL